ncbi:MAG: hypothetical protein IT359_10835 [Gemmatimonadaceae bacterium]|nr:hypothetical protein [Gemmatimonadaceae bacterium]
MHRSIDIDITFDFRRDTPPGRDPDLLSPALRAYHRFLWSKPLPGGSPFELSASRPNAYLHHHSPLGEFFLASDAVVPTFRKESRLASAIAQIPADEWESFMSLGYTIGGMMIFPANRVDRRMTINGARGFHPRIKDRFDLTVECIRRHYRAEKSPLSVTLSRYSAFFALFESFEGYVDFFLLHDLVSPDFRSVRFFAPFDDFSSSPLPADLKAYESYRKHAIAFLSARNARIHRSHGS